jgi:signal peptidase I
MNDTPLRRRLNLDSADAIAPKPTPAPQALPAWDYDIPENAAPTPSVRRIVLDLLETAIFILLIFFIVRSVQQNFKIEGQSMEPNLHNGQYILVNKLVYFHFDLNAPLRLLPGNRDLPEKEVYLFHQPQRGDIIVFEYPNDIKKDYIKRVIGVAGDEVAIRENKVYVNGKLLDEPYLEGQSTRCESYNACGRGAVTVPPGTVFVMGDNRGNSSDSREWDSLPLERVIGKAAFIYFPFSDVGLIQSHSFPADQ